MKRLVVVWALLLGVGILNGTCFAATTEGRKDLLPLGSNAPDFSLEDVVTKQKVSLGDFLNKKATVVMFICKHCSYVQHVKKAIAELGHDYAGREVALIGISSNDPTAYAEDAPE